MEKKCQTFSLEDLSRFVDDDMDRNVGRRIKDHLETCPGCRDAVLHFRKTSQAVAGAVYRNVEQMDTTGLARQVFLTTSGTRDRFYKKVFDYFSLKLYLKIASIVAVAVIGLVYFADIPAPVATPSAVVKSIDGNMSSVMIFETQKTKHTIIWFSEI